MNTELITKCIERVYNELGTGHSEDAYHKALGILLNKAGFGVCFKQKLNLTIDDIYVGFVEPDLLIHSADCPAPFIIECKAVCSKLGEKEMQQLKMYSRLINNSGGLIVNFGQGSAKLEAKSL